MYLRIPGIRGGRANNQKGHEWESSRSDWAPVGGKVDDFGLVESSKVRAGGSCLFIALHPQCLRGKSRKKEQTRHRFLQRKIQLARRDIKKTRLGTGWTKAAL